MIPFGWDGVTEDPRPDKLFTFLLTSELYVKEFTRSVNELVF
jgi:hypothetical protein